MSQDFAQVGVYATPLEACEAVGVQYKEYYNRGGFACLALYDGGKTDGRMKRFADGRGGLIFNQREKTMAVWIDGYETGLKLKRKQKAEIKRQAEINRIQFEAQEKAKHELASRYSALFYRSAMPCSSHPYLTKKHVPMVDTLRVIEYDTAFSILESYYRDAGRPTPHSFPTSVRGGLSANAPLLVVPMRGEAKDFQALQLIDENGAKSFLWGCKKSGSYWQTMALPEFDKSPDLRIGIAEGVATALSVAYVKGMPVVSAMDCGNLTPVALQIRARFPRAKIVICSDVGNGEKDAQKASQAIKGELAVPMFTDALRAEFARLTGKETPTDFNDFYLAKGDLL